MQDKSPAPQTADWEAIWKARAVAPLVLGGPVLEKVRRDLLARARDLGFQQTDALDLHLEIDGGRIAPLDVHDGQVVFLLPASTPAAWLASRSGVPKHHDPLSDDARQLGVAIAAIQIDDGMCSSVTVNLNDPALAEGFHPIERSGDSAWRWTNGNALLRGCLWSRFASIVRLRVTVMSVQLAWR